MLTPDIRERPLAIDGVLNLPAVFAVCDGMGGEEDGENASLLAVQRLMSIDGNIKSILLEQLDELIQSYVDEVSKSIQDVKDGNKLTRCIGIGDDSIVESYPPITGKCRVLICSDGLTDMVSETEIESILRVSERTANTADYLLDTALKNGGNDNTTIIVIDVEAAKTPFFQGLTKLLKG